MEARLIFNYDREGDILHIDKRAPYPEQETEELGDDILRASIQRMVKLKTLRFSFSLHVF